MMPRCHAFIRLLLIAATLLPLVAGARDSAPQAITEVAVAALPVEARRTIELIKRGGPFPYQRDAAVFGNYERLLPARPRGYYREFTVATPGASYRGARRIVAGGGEYFYTADHYRSFQRVRE